MTHRKLGLEEQRDQLAAREMHIIWQRLFAALALLALPSFLELGQCYAATLANRSKNLFRCLFQCLCWKRKEVNLERLFLLSRLGLFCRPVRICVRWTCHQ